MSGYALGGYILTAVVLAGYSARVLFRVRALKRELPGDPVGVRRRSQ